jgi:hypothetical protein
VVDAASASSIVYTKGGKVWRSSPDGRHQAKLTRDGGYSSPSQDDRGRVYAIQRRFVRLSPRGRHIGAPFNAAVGRSGNVTAYGHWEAEVSPDGGRIAYWRGRPHGLRRPDLRPTRQRDRVRAGRAGQAGRRPLRLVVRQLLRQGEADRPRSS